MKKISCLLLALLLTHASFDDAFARAGGGFSGGSRGGRTYSAPSYSAAPLQRSTTARPATASPSYNPSAGMAMPASSGGGFMRGIAGGLVGAGLAHMLFGGMGGGYGGGMGGGGGFGILPLLLIAGAVYFFIRRRRSGGNVMDLGGLSGSFMQNSPPPPAAPHDQPLAISSGDQAAFGDVLQNVQRCWSAGDLNALRQYATPEMVQYFSEQLSANASRGLANKVEQVTLDHAEVLESWSEYGLDYATARLSWHAFDSMVPLGQPSAATDLVASGTAGRSEPVEEIWTFARATGGHWLLSAIQQTN